MQYNLYTKKLVITTEKQFICKIKSLNFQISFHTTNFFPTASDSHAVRLILHNLVFETYSKCCFIPIYKYLQVLNEIRFMNAFISRLLCVLFAQV